MASPGVNVAPQTRIGLFRRSIALFCLIFLVSVLSMLFFQGIAGSRSAELSGYPDEPAHYITAMMCRNYLLGGWRSESAVDYAENYYLHYPKVAIGHWPPVFYVVQFVWMLAFPTTISSLLYLQAVLIAAIAGILFLLARNRFGFVIGVLVWAAFLILRPTQVLASEIMSEPLLALVSLAATWVIARYFETGEMKFMIWFIVFAELAAHTKGSGIEFAGIPVLIAICLRRTDELRKRSFWLSQLALVAIMAPWQILTWRMVHNGMVSAGAQQIVQQTRDFVPMLAGIFGWPLLAAIVAGAVIALVDKKLDALFVACSVTAVVTFVFHCISPNGAEDRRLYMAIPGALILAAFAVWRLLEAWNHPSWTPAALMVLMAVSLAPSWTVFHKVAVGYRTVCGWLLSHSTPGEDAVLIASDVDGEGMLVSEVGQVQPKPTLYLVRSRKLFDNCDWSGDECRPTVTDPAHAQQVMDSIPVRYVVVDRFPGLASSPQADLLRRTIAERPDLWTLRDTQNAIAPGSRERGEIRIYQRASMPTTDHVRLRIDLSRMIGRVIGR
jgi:hypothetical protein